MIVMFCGHSDYIYDEEKKRKLENTIIDCLNKGATDFWLGGYGTFDLMSASVVKNLKLKYKGIRSVLVIPYISKDYDKNLYDCSTYPPIEHIPLRFAITERNKWMVDKSDIVISGVMRSYGGAAKTLEYAKRSGKHIISIYN